MADLLAAMLMHILEGFFHLGEGHEHMFPLQGRQLESTNDDAFWVESSNNTYVPSDNVKNGYLLNPKKLSLTAEYLTSALTLPILFLVLGLVAGILTSLGLICRCCFKCCKCLPKARGETEEERRHSIKTQKRGWTILFYILALFVLISNFLCYYGYDNIDQGVNKFYEAMELLHNLVQTVTLATKTMNDPDALDMEKYMTAATSSCCGTTGLTATASYGCKTTLDGLVGTKLPIFSSATLAIYNAVNPFNKSIGLFIDLTEQYLFDYRKIFIFTIFAVALVEVILLVTAQVSFLLSFIFPRTTHASLTFSSPLLLSSLVSKILHSRKLSKFAIFMGVIFFLLIVILCCPFMIMTSLFGGLCYPNPAQNLARQVTGSTRDLIVFYSTCRGSDSVGENFEKARDAFNFIAYAVNQTATSFCPLGDTNMNQFRIAAVDVSKQLRNIKTQVSCPMLKNVVLTFLNDSLCGGIYSGIYSIWISQLITSFFLLLLLIVASILYQYFDVELGDKVIAGDDSVSAVEDGQVHHGKEAILGENEGAVEAMPIEEDFGVELAREKQETLAQDKQN